MIEERLTGPDDPRVALYRDIADGEIVRSRSLFVAEGRLVVRRAIEDGRYRVRSVLVNDAALGGLRDVLNRLPPDARVLVSAQEHFRAIAGFNIHRGCLALVERPAPLSIHDVLAARHTIAVLEGVSNADNVGGVFRNAVAFGAGAILLSPSCCDPFYRKAIRTSMGSVLKVPWARVTPWPDALVHVRSAGFTLIALTPRSPSESLDEYTARPHPERIALVVGTEGAGLSQDVEDMADVRVRIPMAAGVDSLNLAVATGIALYALSVQSEGRLQIRQASDQAESIL